MIHSIDIIEILEDSQRMSLPIVELFETVTIGKEIQDRISWVYHDDQDKVDELLDEYHNYLPPKKRNVASVEVMVSRLEPEKPRELLSKIKYLKYAGKY